MPLPFSPSRVDHQQPEQAELWDLLGSMASSISSFLEIIFTCDISQFLVARKIKTQKILIIIQIIIWLILCNLRVLVLSYSSVVGGEAEW